MANEVVQLTRNMGTQEEPIREKWYPVVLADNVMMKPEDNAQTIVEWILEQIGLLDADSAELLQIINDIKNYIDEDTDFSKRILALLALKVDKEDGKGLSSNDFTDEEKEKLRRLTLETLTYTNKRPILHKTGGIEPGTIFDGTEIGDVLDMLLCPYEPPTSDYLYCGTTCVNGMIGEKGSAISLHVLPLTTTVTKTSAEIDYVSLINVDIEVCRVENIPEDGSVTFAMDPEESLNIIDDCEVDIVVQDVENGYNIISNKISFVYPMYFGTIGEGTVFDGTITGYMNKIISKKETQKFTITSSYQKIAFAHPTNIGRLLSIKDTNDNELLGVFDKNIINVQCRDESEQQYTLYTSHYYTTLDNYEIRFIFEQEG